MIKASEGSFQAGANQQVMDCDGTADAITHTINTDKSSVTVTYVPPASAAGSIGLRLTVAVNHDKYWNPSLFTLSQNGVYALLRSAIMLALVLLSLLAGSQAYMTGAPIDACAEGIRTITRPCQS
ncbi:uncharacterized protein LOC144859924 [Branchiostoma floridae x Branchiostoma japonicum]